MTQYAMTPRLALIARIEILEVALQPFAQVLIGEHRHDEENAWHSLKVHHFRDARRALRNHGGGRGHEHD